MKFLDFFKYLFGKKKDEKLSNNKDNKTKIKEDMKTKNNKQVDDKSFHPEILFLINRADAEYVNFEEVK